MDEKEAAEEYVKNNYRDLDYLEEIQICVQEVDSIGDKCSEISYWNVEVRFEPTFYATKITV